MDAGHQRGIGGQGRRQWYLLLPELLGGVVQVELVEHGVAPVAGQCLPVVAAEGAALLKEAAQVGALGQGVAVDGLVDAVAAHLVVAFAHGGDVDTLAGGERDVPVVARHAGDDVVARQVPAGGHVGVLNPYILVLLGERHLGDGVLHEDRGMGFAVEVHNLALVADEVLNGERRRDHLATSAEVVELAARQGQDGDAQRAQLGVVDGRVGAQGAAELAVEVVWDETLPQPLPRGRGVIRREGL